MSKPKRALLSCSDKTGLEALGQCLHRHGVELVATGKTADVLRKSGLPVVNVDTYSGTPEAFQGRMKTLSFPLLSGILFRRGDDSDARDVAALKVPAIDLVVVNFYPFEKDPTVEQIDIGGPTLVRAAAKNSPDVVVLVDPDQYPLIIEEMNGHAGEISAELAKKCSARTWERVLAYDQAIAQTYGERVALRYGENPHQSATFYAAPDSPIEWRSLTDQQLSYNNILDLSSGFALLQQLHEWKPDARIAVVIKHGNPCGVALSETQSIASVLEHAWQGDPVSAFGGVVLLNYPIDAEVVGFLSTRFIEALAAPQLAASSKLGELVRTRKKLKAIAIKHWDMTAATETVSVVGGTLVQTVDRGIDEELKPVTRKLLHTKASQLAPFGVAIARALKSNAVAAVGALADGSLALLGAGQGQPNRVEAIRDLCIPRALQAMERFGLKWSDVVAVSDAFFPFADSVTLLAQAGCTQIIQPGGSIKDGDVIAEADRLGVAMVMTGRRHFKHV